MKTILDAFPDHLFIAEETASDNVLTDAPTWVYLAKRVFFEESKFHQIIDPIDGTTNFVHRFELFRLHG